MVWAADVKVAGSSPAGGISARICKYAISQMDRLSALRLLLVRLRVLSLALVRDKVLFALSARLCAPPQKPSISPYI